MTGLLAEQRVAYDIQSYRDAPAGPAHLVRRHGRDLRRRGAAALARLGLRRDPRPARLSRSAADRPTEHCHAESADRRPAQPGRRGHLQGARPRGRDPGRPEAGRARSPSSASSTGWPSARPPRSRPRCWPPASRLKVVGRAGIGVDNIDVEAATQRGVVVMNTPFGNSVTTAEHAISLMLALARQIPAADRSTRAGKWEKNRFMGVELMGKVLGLVGCGNIGSIVADRAHGLKMRVIAYDPFLSAERAQRPRRREGRPRRAARRAPTSSSLHTPLTEQTRNILVARRSDADQAGRAPGQLRPRRPGRRAGRGRPDPRRAHRRRRLRRVRGRARPQNPRCSGSTRWWSPRISAPRPARRRRTWRCRWPSRSATT